jgi:uncharacterized Zn finger protein
MPRKKQQANREDPAAEYLDSPLMSQRLLYKRELLVRIDGRYGTYRTRLKLGRRLNGRCSCPSEEVPCKHVRALSGTWRVNPESFFDLQPCLEALSQRPLASLVASIAELVLNRPEALTAFGVSGFEPDEEGEEW